MTYLVGYWMTGSDTFKVRGEFDSSYDATIFRDTLNKELENQNEKVRVKTIELAGR